LLEEQQLELLKLEARLANLKNCWNAHSKLKSKRAKPQPICTDKPNRSEGNAEGFVASSPKALKHAASFSI